MSGSSPPSCWRISAIRSAASTTPMPRLRSSAEDEFAADLVFSDVIMPGMNGVELAGVIRDRYPGLPVVLTSGYSNVLAENAHRGFELIQKPYSVESLSRILRKAISDARLVAQERGSCRRILALFDHDLDDAGAHHAERPRRADRDVDDPAANERAAVVDAAFDRVAAVGNPERAPERPAAVRARHLAASADSTIVRRKPALCMRQRTAEQQHGRTNTRNSH